jgi:hypothetical protein
MVGALSASFNIPRAADLVRARCRPSRWTLVTVTTVAGLERGHELSHSGWPRERRPHSRGSDTIYREKTSGARAALQSGKGIEASRAHNQLIARLRRKPRSPTKKAPRRSAGLRWPLWRSVQ